MTPEEFAAQTGLSLEEAEMVLRRRNELAASVAIDPMDERSKRINRALEALKHAEKKVGVKPYEESK